MTHVSSATITISVAHSVKRALAGKRALEALGYEDATSRKYLPFYLAELDFKYNTRKMTDGARTADAIPKIVGKRLMLRRPKGEE